MSDSGSSDPSGPADRGFSTRPPIPTSSPDDAALGHVLNVFSKAEYPHLDDVYPVIMRELTFRRNSSLGVFSAETLDGARRAIEQKSADEGFPLAAPSATSPQPRVPNSPLTHPRGTTSPGANIANRWHEASGKFRNSWVRGHIGMLIGMLIGFILACVFSGRFAAMATRPAGISSTGTDWVTFVIFLVIVALAAFFGCLFDPRRPRSNNYPRPTPPGPPR